MYKRSLKLRYGSYTVDKVFPQAASSFFFFNKKNKHEDSPTSEVQHFAEQGGQSVQVLCKEFLTTTRALEFAWH